MTNLKENNQKINLYEQYIKCAIQNGLIEKMLGEPYEKLIDLDVGEYQVYFHGIIKNGHTFTDTYDIIRLITSKEFIEAIVFGIFKRDGAEEAMRRVFKDDIIDNTTKDQALAIRDGKLDNFIKNILNIK